jgi:hypothetical protein
MQERRSEGAWADVKVFDVDDIEQALELAPAVHARFSEIVGKPGHLPSADRNRWHSSSTAPSRCPTICSAGAHPGARS